MATSTDAATALPESPMPPATLQLWEKREGRFVCLERHSEIQPVTCGKDFASKQALEAHRMRTGCDAAKLPSDRPVSRLHGLVPEAARQVRHQSNHAAVVKYRTTIAGKRAVFRARHMAKYRALAMTAVSEPPQPEAPEYMPPPISWLLADAPVSPEEVKPKFESSQIRLSHSTWSLRFHPDKVEVRGLEFHSAIIVLSNSLKVYIHSYHVEFACTLINIFRSRFYSQCTLANNQGINGYLPLRLQGEAQSIWKTSNDTLKPIALNKRL
jgi:hypothetical protein